MTDPAIVRAFLALSLDPGAVGRITALGKRLRNARSAPPATWTRTENLHLTIKFFASIEVARIPSVVEAVRPLAEGHDAPRPVAQGLDAFPSRSQARVLIVNMRDDTGEVPRLAAEAELRAEALGFPREVRAFRPHVTLARFKTPTDVRAWLAEETPDDLGECLAPELVFYESKPSSRGSDYTPLVRMAYR